MGFYRDEFRPAFDPKRTLLYRRPERDTWQVRIRLDTGSYLVRSLRTSSKDVAYERARDLWAKTRTSSMGGVVYTDRKFDSIARIYIRERLDASRLKHRKAIGRFNNWLIPYFGSEKVESIDNYRWEQYVLWRSDKRKGQTKKDNPDGTPYRVSIGTLMEERAVLKAFLLWCVGKGYVSSAPSLEWKSFGKRGTNRGELYLKRRTSMDFPEDVWMQVERKLRRVAFWTRYGAKRDYGLECSIHDVSREDANRWFVENRKRSEDEMRKFCGRGLGKQFDLATYGNLRLYYFAIICYHTFIRASAGASRMRYKHTRIRKSDEAEGYAYAVLTVPETKKGEAREGVISTYKGAVHLMRWRNICRDYGLGEDEDFVFSGLDGKPIRAGIVGRKFVRLLEAWGLRYDPLGRSRTLYGFTRHSRVRRALVDSKMDLLTLSQAMNTRIDTIATAYASLIMQGKADLVANTFAGDPTIDEALVEEVGRRLLDYKSKKP